MIDNSLRYSFKGIDARNAMWNFIMGARGLGKTYGWKKKAIRASIKRGNEFMYVRRYSEEIKKSKANFFSDIEHEFPDHSLKVEGDKAYWAHASTEGDKKREWYVLGHFVALSVAAGLKSVSFHNVTSIAYDEFILEKGFTRELPNEVEAALGLFNTVSRYRENVKMYFMANTVTINNKYFRRYKIRPDETTKEFIMLADGFIACHFPDSADFTEAVKRTRFGAFIANHNQEYSETAISNRFNDNHKSLVSPRDSRARYVFSVETKIGTVAIWKNNFSGMYYAESARPKSEIIYTLVPERMSEGKIQLQINHPLIQGLRTAWRRGNIMFDTQETRNTYIEVFG